MGQSLLRVLLTAEQIQERVREIGTRIDADYLEGPIHLIGVLKGSVFFLSDLARVLTLPVRVDFVGVSSYGKGKTTSGEVTLTKDIDLPIEGADVLVVEDIVDSGITLQYIIRLLEQRQPRSLRVAALLDKPARRARAVSIDYVGFQIPNCFVVGYGLDLAGRYRELRDICVLDDEACE